MNNDDRAHVDWLPMERQLAREIPDMLDLSAEAEVVVKIHGDLHPVFDVKMKLNGPLKEEDVTRYKERLSNLFGAPVVSVEYNSTVVSTGTRGKKSPRLGLRVVLKR